MMRRLHDTRRSGFILIFSLWVLGFLTILAVGLAAGVRQKIRLVEQLEGRSQTEYTIDAAILRIRTYLKAQLDAHQYIYDSALKSSLHNNPAIFARMLLGQHEASCIDAAHKANVEHYGLMDEERKININKTNPLVLTRLISKVLAIDEEEASVKARSILDWRQWGDRDAKGFFSDDYYAQLQFPYPKKDAEYELIDELLLVKGITRPMFEKLRDYLTTVGDGKVNINTASHEVLYALGIEEGLADKIISVRRGKDGEDSTMDDVFFARTFDVASDVGAVIKLTLNEIHAIDALSIQQMIGLNSYYFSGRIVTHMARQVHERQVRFIISSREDQVVYYFEK